MRDCLTIEGELFIEEMFLKGSSEAMFVLAAFYSLIT